MILVKRRVRAAFWTVMFFAAVCILSVCIAAGTGTAASAAETGTAAAEGSRRVFDRAGLFSGDAAEQMEAKIADMRSEMNMDVVLVTTDDTGGETAGDYAESFYIDGDFGVGKEYDGVIFLIDMDNRELYLAPSGKMNRYLTDSRWNSILDDAYEGAAGGDYEASANAFLSGVEKYYKAGIPSGQHNYDRDTGKISVYRSIRWYEALLALIVAGGCAVMPCLGVIRQYSMKKERRQAENYLMAYRGDCKFQFASQADDLMNKTVTHIIIPRNNDHGSGNMRGGGGSSGRSTTHTSSGRSFGGGGRKF